MRLLLLLALFAIPACHSQVKFTVDQNNCYTLQDTLNDIVYSFDSGSDRANLFDRGRLAHSFRGFTLVQNSEGKFRFKKIGRIKQEVPGLGLMKINANILLGKRSADTVCYGIDLMLGARQMKKHKLSFNNKTGTMTRLAALPADISVYTKLKLSRGLLDHHYYTTLSINGAEEVFLVDTGYSGQVALASGKDLGTSRDSHTFYTLAGFEAARHTLTEHAGNTISHDGVTFKNDVVYSFGTDGNNFIGNAFFLNFEEVIFDLADKAIYLRNEGERYDPFSEDILFSPTTNNTIAIIYLKESSSYYKQGYRTGDTIILDDKELEASLLNTPCNTISILRSWKARHSVPYRFSKKSG